MGGQWLWLVLLLLALLGPFVSGHAQSNADATFLATLGELREASYALGIPKWKTIARIVVPTALPGIISGILLALARVMGETAPVLVLVGYARSINYGSFSYSQLGSVFDIVSGSNGSCGSYLCTGTVGFDGPTGNGTPGGTFLSTFRVHQPPDPRPRSS